LEPRQRRNLRQRTEKEVEGLRLREREREESVLSHWTEEGD